MMVNDIGSRATDGQSPINNHTILALDSQGDLHQMLWQTVSRKIFRNIGHLAVINAR